MHWRVPGRPGGLDLGLVSGEADVAEQPFVQTAKRPARLGDGDHVQDVAQKADGADGPGPKRCKAVGKHGNPPFIWFGDAGQVQHQDA